MAGDDDAGKDAVVVAGAGAATAACPAEGAANAMNAAATAAQIVARTIISPSISNNGRTSAEALARFPADPGSAV